MRFERYRRWIVAASAAPLLAACYGSACTADTLRDVASGLSEAADRVDDEDRDKDLGDYLVDLVEDL
ncbi:MAG: hypothetical protein GY842_01110 [bacterium]|nr:hypothetical protein [bacterium]